MGPTTTVETVSVVRPIKVMALICGCCTLILLIMAIAADVWLEADDYKQGLWRECNVIDGNTECNSNSDIAYIAACGALCIISCLVALAGTVLIGVGLISKNPDTKAMVYKVAMLAMFFAMLCVLVSVIVFPIMFMQEIEERGKPQWYFGWAYGTAWGAVIFLVAAAILLLIDKENDEIYFREKTYYSDA